MPLCILHTCLQVKIITRRAFGIHQLSAQQLVELMHGISRMPRYAPNIGWLQALCLEVQRDVRSVTPGGLDVTPCNGMLGIPLAQQDYDNIRET